MIKLPVTKPNQVKYCSSICFFAMSLQKRGLRLKDRVLNGRAATCGGSSVRMDYLGGGGMLLLLCHSKLGLSARFCNDIANKQIT